MNVYDPLSHRTLVSRPGETSYKFWAVNKLLRDMAAAGVIKLTAAEVAPSDTSVIWLDVNSPEIEGGVGKAFDGVDWVPLTRQLFRDHIGAASPGEAAWGGITGVLASQTDLQAALNAKLDDSQASAFGLTLIDDVDAATARGTLGLGTIATQNANNVTITGGFVQANNTGLAVLDTDSSHKLLIVPGSNLTADRNLNIVTGDSTRTLTLNGDTTLNGTNSGDVTLAGAPGYLTIVGQVITRALIDLASHVTGKLPLANMGDVATSSVFYRKTAGTGAPEVQTLATLKTDLGLTGTNSGDQTITLTGDVTGSGTGSFAATIANGVVTLAKLANMATGSVFYRKTAGTGAPEVQTLATLKTDLGLTGTNSGDQTIALTGDVSGSGTGSFAATLATVNSNTGSWGLAGSVAQFTVNAKGLITAAANVAISIASTAISDSTAAGRAMLTAATAAAQTALLSVMVGDSGSGGTKGLVPAPAAGDATKAFFGDGTFKTIPGGGDALTSNPLSQFAATTSAQLRGVISDETGTGLAYFQGGDMGTPSSGNLANCTGLPVAGGGTGNVSGVNWALHALCGGI